MESLALAYHVGVKGRYAKRERERERERDREREREHPLGGLISVGLI